MPSNALAVYSSKPAITGKSLLALATNAGLQLRYLAMGGMIPADPESFQGSLKLAGAGAMLVVGASPTELELLTQFDELVGLRDRVPLAKLLNAGQLGWIELLTAAFDYPKHLARFPNDKTSLESSFSKQQLPKLKSSKTRYIVYNQSKSNPGELLMRSLADLLAQSTEGVVVNHIKTKR